MGVIAQKKGVRSGQKWGYYKRELGHKEHLVLFIAIIEQTAL